MSRLDRLRLLVGGALIDAGLWMLPTEAHPPEPAETLPWTHEDRAVLARLGIVA